MNRIVISKAGRDKDLWFIVIKADGDYFFLVDGKTRTLKKPKKKKRKHVGLTNYFADLVIPDGRALQDADVCKALNRYNMCTESNAAAKSGCTSVENVFVVREVS